MSIMLRSKHHNTGNLSVKMNTHLGVLLCMNNSSECTEFLYGIIKGNQSVKYLLSARINLYN